MTAPLQFANAAFNLARALLGGECGVSRSSAAVRATELERAVAATPSVAALAERFALTPSERDQVCVLFALAFDAESRAMFARRSIHATPTSEELRELVYLTPFETHALRETALSGTLRRLHLLERAETGGAASSSGERWTLSSRVCSFIAGDATASHELTSFGVNVPSVRDLDELCVDACTLQEIQAAVRTPNVVVAAGSPGLGRRTVLIASAKEAGVDILEIEARKLSTDHAQLKRQLKLIARECLLLQRAPLIRNIDSLLGENEHARVDIVGSELACEIDGPVFVTCGLRRPAMRWNRQTIVVEVRPPTSTRRAKLWSDTLGQGSQRDAEFLATQFPLAPALIQGATAVAKTRAAGRKIQPEDIYAGVRAVLDDRLGDFAKRVDVTQSWDDIVLPADQLQQVKYLIARIRQRRTVYEQWGFAAKVGKGLGTSALFSGPPGTGKTMVAGLIAKELGLELYQVDMAKVVSKWIGETERNLAALFDAAEAGHAVLLFDEADSLFGKRTDVRSSNDRYANLETNYLLQRLESFTGICLLTSNHESAIDSAFMRRLSLHVRFELPDVDEREQLWRAMLPIAAPVADDIDAPSLARRFAMSGGYIRNAALRAAFMAADEGAAISGRHLELAAKLEYEGMGKIALS